MDLKDLKEGKDVTGVEDELAFAALWAFWTGGLTGQFNGCSALVRDTR